MAADWQTTWAYLQHVGTAFLLTAVVGWERESHSRGAGLRTFPIVGMASCAYVLLLGLTTTPDAQSRLLQGLITGIGFIGGGAILKEGSTVKGTATAASIMNAAVIGAAVALGKSDIAIALTLLNLFIMRALLPMKRWIDKRRTKPNVPRTAPP